MTLAEDAKRHTEARRIGVELGALDPDIITFQKELERGWAKSTSSFTTGFIDGAKEKASLWSTWLSEGLSETGVVSKHWGIADYVEHEYAEWKARRKFEPWLALTVHTSGFGRQRCEPAQLLATLDPNAWRNTLDKVTVPSLLVWLTVAGTPEAKPESWLSEIENAPNVLNATPNGWLPTGEMRTFALARVYVEHFEELEGKALHGTMGEQTAIVAEAAAALARSLLQREDGKHACGQIMSYLGQRHLYPIGYRSQLATSQIFLRNFGKILEENDVNVASVLKATDGRRRKSLKAWKQNKPNIRRIVRSSQPDPPTPHAEGAPSENEIDGIVTWAALASANTTSEDATETWRLFKQLVEKRDAGLRRLVYPTHPSPVPALAAATLSRTQDPILCWRKLYEATEPHRRRSEHHHRYIDIDVGLTTELAIEIGTLTCGLLQHRSDEMFCLVEEAARRAWLDPPGGHGINWERLYAWTLASAPSQKPESTISLLKPWGKSPTLVCATLSRLAARYPEATPEFAKQFERETGASIALIVDEAREMLGDYLEVHPSLLAWVEG